MKRFPSLASVARAGLLGLSCSVATMVSAADDAPEGLQSVESPHDVATTLDRLEAVLGEKGMNVFGRVDHAANAAGAELELRPTSLLIFGNPKVGTPLMNCAQSVAIDLPQKMLAWQDEAGTVHLGWNDPAWLAARHGVESEQCLAVIEKVDGALRSFAAAAVAP